ncbi:CFI-box-CTERM domain-containing protein [Pseudomonas saliphila]|uniref:CFI-box-CTERM domain-containing protein n=1 Tax=Pseudomonas saliphila TaxID=2586906 RepID=UPI00123C3F33|nr:CFI-box-CTERM domain-containing protein [Pseudomonas saliphila]
MEQTDIEKFTEAEQYQLKAMFILHELQANKQVYGSNSSITGAAPANIDLALQYIDRSIELVPDSAIYLNLKALLLWEGNGNKEAAIPLLERAAQLSPRDIDIQNNLNAIKTSQCVVATAAFGTPLAIEVNLLRWWRDKILSKSAYGRLFVSSYYSVSPPIARFISSHNNIRALVRLLLRPIIRHAQRLKSSV